MQLKHPESASSAIFVTPLEKNSHNTNILLQNNGQLAPRFDHGLHLKNMHKHPNTPTGAGHADRAAHAPTS